MTAPSEEKAAELAKVLLQERLIACANLVPAIRSLYRWEGAIADEREVLMVIKTRAALFPQVRDRLLALHPYQVPEVLQVPVTAGSAKYLEWVLGETQNP